MATRTMFLVLFVVKPWLIFVREHGNSERILDALVMVKLLPTLKQVINVNNQKKFYRFMNVPESDAQASSLFIFFFYLFFLSRRRIADVFLL